MPQLGEQTPQQDVEFDHFVPKSNEPVLESLLEDIQYWVIQCISFYQHGNFEALYKYLDEVETLADSAYSLYYHEEK